jgi:hypothetical protein
MVDIGRDAVDVGGASRVKFLDRRAIFAMNRWVLTSEIGRYSGRRVPQCVG